MSRTPRSTRLRVRHTNSMDTWGGLCCARRNAASPEKLSEMGDRTLIRLLRKGFVDVIPSISAVWMGRGVLGARDWRWASARKRRNPHPASEKCSSWASSGRGGFGPEAVPRAEAGGRLKPAPCHAGGAASRPRTTPSHRTHAIVRVTHSTDEA